MIAKKFGVKVVLCDDVKLLCITFFFRYNVVCYKTHGKPVTDWQSRVVNEIHAAYGLVYIGQTSALLRTER